ncbi:MAG: porin family protein [Acidobacteriia bacterium]|nr:porin family protein [Terriglobia bacterium]
MTPRKWLSLGCLLAAPVAAPLVAQPLARQFSFSAGTGGAIPREDLTSFMTTSPLLTIGFGYRPIKYLQADVGLDAVFHAAGVRDFQDTIIGRLKISDNEIMVPLGGRGILPIGPRVELFGGGGTVYLHYGESVEVPGGGSDSSFNCQTCRSRGGWGYYTTAGVNVAVERSRRFWVGVESRLIHGKTNGDPLGAVPPLETTDTWINTAAVFTFRFP